jgi:hypothetical protein
MWRWLWMLAHPQHRPFDLRAEVSSSYRLFYDRSPTAAQLDQVLWTSANAGSAHYERFHAS